MGRAPVSGGLRQMSGRAEDAWSHPRGAPAKLGTGAGVWAASNAPAQPKDLPPGVSQRRWAPMRCAGAGLVRPLLSPDALWSGPELLAPARAPGRSRPGGPGWEEQSGHRFPRGIPPIGSVVRRGHRGASGGTAQSESHAHASSARDPRVTREDVTGRMLPLEARHRQRAWGAQVQRLGGSSLFRARDSHPTRREGSVDLCVDPRPGRRRGPEAERWDKGQGGRDQRHLLGSPDLNDWFSKEWAGREHGFHRARPARRVQTQDPRREGVSGLSSLSRQPARPVRLLALIRAHGASDQRRHQRWDGS